MKKAKKVKKTKASAKPKKKAKAKAKPASKKVSKKTAKPAKKKIVAKNIAKAKPATKNNNNKIKVRGSKAAATAKRAIDLPVPMAPKPAPVPVRKEDTDKQLFLAQKPSVPLRIPVKSVLPPAKKSRVKENGNNKTRYNDKELEEFRLIILKKIEEANKELENLQAQMTSANDHGTDDTANTFKVLEDGSDTLAKEEAGQLAARQKKFIEQLENALIRIENKTYGICRVTGKLIPKERLRAVPHTTQSIEAKLSQYRD